MLPLPTPIFVEHALIVDDDETLAATLAGLVSRHAANVHTAMSRAEALRTLGKVSVDVLVLDVVLPDGSSADVLAAAAAQPRFPRVIAISGSAEPAAAFQLAQAGVRCFVPKPIDREGFLRTWDCALRTAPDIGPFIRSSLGSRKLHELEDQVRRELVDEALATCRGSRHKASSLLGISRQLLQQILRRRS